MTSIKHYIQSFTLSIPVAIVIGSFIISFGIISYGFIMKGGTVAQNGIPSKIFLGKAVGNDEAVYGNQKSKVFLVEYSDTECPYCSDFYNTIKQIMPEYKEKIGFVYRNFPLTNIHPHAQKESEALLCAEKLGGTNAYYGMMFALFDYKVANNTTQLKAGVMNTLFGQVALNVDKANECLNSGEMTQKVTASIQDGITAGVKGTPSSFVLLKTKKGYEVIDAMEGGRPYAYMKQVLDAALSR